MFNKVAPNNKTLFNYLQWCTPCYFTLRRIKHQKDYKEISLTEYILDVKKGGLIVATLVDNSGNSTHAVGINLDTRMIYDCQEKYVLNLTKDNLSVCCGLNKVFVQFCKVGELWNQHPRRNEQLC